LYGVPTFLKDSNGNPQHGDARNEYGLFALNQFLGVGSMAYVVRANVNLNDNFADLLAMWNSSMQDSAYTLQNLASSYISQYNTSNGYLPGQGTDIATFGSIVPGTNYAAGVYTNVALTNVTGTGSGARATISVAGGVKTFGAIVGGSVYTPSTGTATYTNVALTGGTGSGAKATITVTNGAVSAVVLTVSGHGFTNGDVLTTGNANIGGTGSGFTVLVATTQIGGLNTLGSIVPGTVYTNGTYNGVALSNITGSGTGATANIVVSGAVVTGVTLVSLGTGYNVGDVLSATAGLIGGTGSGFSVPVATVYDGGVTGVALTAPGIGYVVANSLSAATANLGGGAGAGFTVAVATVSSAYKTSLTEAEFLSLAETATHPTFALSSFGNSYSSFYADYTTTPVPVYPNGFTNSSVGTFLGMIGRANAWVAGAQGSAAPHTGWTPAEAASTLLNASDAFKFTTLFLNQTSLGANDAARRVAIVQALAAVINSNPDVRSETYEYNLILCPGFPELAQEMDNLSVDIQDEAMPIADTPFTATPDTVVTWAATTARQTSSSVAYYYPHGLGTNLDGATVFVASSGTALRTIAYSDNVSEVWFAPAGTRRGLVTSISDVGYVTGTLGTATTFVPAPLNLGQRNNLYKYFTNINPIVAFPGRGIIVWGQKTSAPDASAEDRINVSRLIMYIKRSLRKNTMSFVFQPNDKLTQDNLKAMVDAFLGNLITLRGLYDFASVCDGSNNTPERIDANELYIDIALKPVKAAEFIYIPIRIVATGAPLTNA
jgi:hypothetical protein